MGHLGKLSESAIENYIVGYLHCKPKVKINGE